MVNVVQSDKLVGLIDVEIEKGFLYKLAARYYCAFWNFIKRSIIYKRSSKEKDICNMYHTRKNAQRITHFKSL